MGTRDEVLLGTLEHIVLLAVLRLGTEAYGATIRDEIEQRGGRDMSFGAVYVTLQRMEGKGLVTSRLGEPTAERGGRAKKYFHVTVRGLKEVRETQRSLVKLWHGLPELQGGKA